jgi:hypothetical protein
LFRCPHFLPVVAFSTTNYQQLLAPPVLEVDSAKTVDPVTGSFSIPVPIDAIQTVTVDKTPFSAENGVFRGPDKNRNHPAAERLVLQNQRL